MALVLLDQSDIRWCSSHYDSLVLHRDEALQLDYDDERKSEAVRLCRSDHLVPGGRLSCACPSVGRRSIRMVELPGMGLPRHIIGPVPLLWSSAGNNEGAGNDTSADHLQQDGSDRSAVRHAIVDGAVRPHLL